jgi:transcriptional regulator with XRE-family HTH domain
MTYREAAERSGLSHAYIRYLEIGKRPGSNTPINPSPEMLKGLSKAYNHPYKDLMKRAGYSYDEEEDNIEEGEDELKMKEIYRLVNKITKDMGLEETEDLLKRLAREE